MRLFHLAVAAAQAERLRLIALEHRMERRVAVGACALVFAAAAIGCLHVVLFLALDEHLGAIATAVVLAAVDLAAAALLALVALRNRPSEAESTAAILRDQAWSGVRADLSLLQLVPSLVAMLRRHSGGEAPPPS